LLLVYCSCHDRTAVVAAAILRPQLAIAESQKLLIAPAQQRSTFLPRSMPPPPLLLFPPAYDAAERSWPVPALPWPYPPLRCCRFTRLSPSEQQPLFPFYRTKD